MYYNTSRSVFRCYQNGNWRDCMESPRASFHAQADYMGAAGDDTQFAVVNTNSGNWSATNVGSVAGHPGIVEMQTQTLTNGTNFLGAKATSGLLLGNNDTWQFESVQRIPTLSTGTDTYTYRSGFIDSQTAESTDGCFFRYTDGTNAGKWQGVCRSNNNTETTCDTTVTVTANTWYHLTVGVNSGGTSSTFVVFDGASTNQCTVASNIPTGAGRGTGYGSMILKSAGTTNRTIQMDYMEVYGSLNTAR